MRWSLVRWWTAALALLGCAPVGGGVVGSEIGPPTSGWTRPDVRRACAPPDVAPRLHFARISQLTWMEADERADLAGVDLSDTAGAGAERLDRLGLDAATRELAPLALEATGHPEMAEELRALPPLHDRSDLRRARAVAQILGDQLGARTPERRVLIVLERGIRRSMTTGFPELRCADIQGHGTIEAAVAAAALEAGVPRALVTAESLALLERMAREARAG